MPFFKQIKLVGKREDFGWRHLASGTRGLGGDWSAEVVMVASCWRLFLAVSAAHYWDGWVNGCSATGSSDALRESSISCRLSLPQPFALSLSFSHYFVSFSFFFFQIFIKINGWRRYSLVHVVNYLDGNFFPNSSRIWNLNDELK